MLYKLLRSSLNNSILHGAENQGKKIIIQQKKLRAGTLPESPLWSVQGDLARLFLLAGRVDGLSHINEGTRMV